MQPFLCSTDFFHSVAPVHSNFATIALFSGTTTSTHPSSRIALRRQMTSFSGIDDDDVVSESTGLVSNARPPVPRTAAIPIYQEDSEDDVTQQQDDDSDSSSDEYSRDNSVAGEDRNSEDFMCNASPGTGSYVFDVDSWRPVPPPMLASSFDRRIRPSLRLQAKSGRLPSEQPSYGAIDCVNRKRRRTDGPTEDDAQGMSVAKRLMLAQKPAKTAHFSQKAIEASKTHPVDVPSASWRHKLARASVQWNAIFHAPRELWIIFILKLLSSCTLMFSMFLASAILNSQLSKLVGYIYQGGKKKIDTDQPSPTSVRFRFIDAYFSLSLILTMFLSQEFGLSDTSAGWTYGTNREHALQFFKSSPSGGHVRLLTCYCVDSVHYDSADYCLFVCFSCKVCTV